MFFFGRFFFGDRVTWWDFYLIAFQFSMLIIFGRCVMCNIFTLGWYNADSLHFCLGMLKWVLNLLLIKNEEICVNSVELFSHFFGVIIVETTYKYYISINGNIKALLKLFTEIAQILFNFFFYKFSIEISRLKFLYIFYFQQISIFNF